MAMISTIKIVRFTLPIWYILEWPRPGNTTKQASDKCVCYQFVKYMAKELQLNPEKGI
jgi:hypothetical protein